MKHRLILTFAIGSISFLTTQVFSAEADNAAYRQGYGLVLEQKWEEARSYFQQFQADFADSNWVDDAAFWQCYAIEQSATQESEHFSCYENFLNTWPESSWVSDARSKILVLGSRLASRGSPEYMRRIRIGNELEFDFDFDFDSDAIGDAVAQAMDRAQQELERVRISRNAIGIPDLPEIPELSEIVNIEELQRVVQEVRVRGEQTRLQFNRRSRSSADNELLSVLAALRDNSRASEILIDRFDNSSDPEMRARIVLLLEDFRDEQITKKLIDIVRKDETEEVRNNAIIVLVDRKDTAARELLLEIIPDSNYPVSIRSAILADLDRWDEAQAISTLSAVLATETEPRLVRTAADTLADIGSEAALTVLFNSYETTANQENRYRILSEIADIDSPQVLNFLSEAALNATDDEVAAIAIAGIADHENNIAVAALEHIYLNTENAQRRMAAVNGIGESETEQAVDVLRQIIVEEKDLEIIAEAVLALGQTDQAAAVPVILTAYRTTENETVRRAAIRAMRQLDDFPEATDGLLEILEDRLNTESAQ